MWRMKVFYYIEEDMQFEYPKNIMIQKKGMLKDALFMNNMQ